MKRLLVLFGLGLALFAIRACPIDARLLYESHAVVPDRLIDDSILQNHGHGCALTQIRQMTETSERRMRP
jgi:hypothetical protein